MADLIESAIDALTNGAGLTSLVATVGVIWTVSQFYGAVDVALRPHLPRTRRSGTSCGGRRGGFIVVVLIGALIVAFLVVAGVASALDALAAEQVPFAALLARLLGSNWSS